MHIGIPVNHGRFALAAQLTKPSKARGFAFCTRLLKADW